MKRLATTITAVLLGTSLVVAVSGQEQGPDEATKLAKKLTEDGAATFNTANAKAMAAYYTDDAKIFLQTKDQNGVTVKEYDGREEIERAYADLFKDPATIQSKNTVEYAKLLAPDLLVIAGTFVPNLAAAKPLNVPFYQVRVKHGEKWLIHSLRIFAMSQND
jgi:ketosteroid isomerase-like protein